MARILNQSLPFVPSVTEGSPGTVGSCASALGTNMLGISAAYLSSAVSDVGGLTLIDPVRGAVAPAVALAARLVSDSGVLMLLTSLVLLFATLRQLVFTLKRLLIGRLPRAPLPGALSCAVVYRPSQAPETRETWRVRAPTAAL